VRQILNKTNGKMVTVLSGDKFYEEKQDQERAVESWGLRGGVGLSFKQNGWNRRIVSAISQMEKEKHRSSLPDVEQ
jgi:hypothetical protein